MQSISQCLLVPTCLRRAAASFSMCLPRISRAGTDAKRDMSLANVVRILHDDGTYAIYAHLNWNSIRVRLGDHVQRGEYIADSGNTGFSSGPHLHFVVVRNAGMSMSSIPVRFAGADASPVAPVSGQALTAY